MLTQENIEELILNFISDQHKKKMQEIDRALKNIS